tara:strand:- start:1428 stop:3011 length:1584 start_codon:yes stop_codon:yes gene_type:complete
MTIGTLNKVLEKIILFCNQIIHFLKDIKSKPIQIVIVKWIQKQTLLSFFCVSLASIYIIAFLAFLTQYNALIGDQGLLPATNFMANLSSRGMSFLDNPTLFWMHCNSVSLFIIGFIGLTLSFSCLSGRQNALIWFGMWTCYLSIVNVGQIFYGYGWESLLLETGFFTGFFCPIKQYKVPQQSTKNNIISLFILWVLFRNMFGAGLIKLRGDVVWRDFTALFYHFETQPIPNPLSAFFHHLPKAVLKVGVLFNHIAELLLPILLFMPYMFRRIAAIGIIVFQATLILSGNLSWLNYLTIVQCIPAFQSKLIEPQKIISKFKDINYLKTKKHLDYLPVFLISFFTLLMSFYPVNNMLSPKQKMNASFNRFQLLNTYGAFGHVGKTRYELVIMGTTDTMINEDTIWKEYIFKGKPNKTSDSLPIISPFHYRLDWQIWFSAMRPQLQEPWLVHFLYKLLIDDQKTIRLLKNNPFPDKAPSFIKIDRYIFEFDNNRFKSGKVWNRRYIGNYCPPIKKDYDSLIDYLNRFGWI